MPLTSPPLMKITLAGLHAPHVPRLQALLGDRHAVEGLENLPASGLIETDVLVTIRLREDEARRLKCSLLQAPGAGLDAIALDCLAEGIRVCNVYDHEQPIAEFVTHAVLDYAIHPEPPAPMDAAHWPQAYRGRPFHGEAQGRRAAIVGFGVIGRATARRLRAQGLHVTAVTRRRGPQAEAGAAHPVAQLRSLLPEVDVLVLCCPLTQETEGLVGAQELDAMRPDALLVNVGRGPLVQEQALYEALVARRIGRAVLDVWYQYPTAGQTELAPSRFPFHTLPNARCTPHIAGWTQGLLQRRYEFMARNIGRLGRGEALENVVR